MQKASTLSRETEKIRTDFRGGLSGSSSGIFRPSPVLWFAGGPHWNSLLDPGVSREVLRMRLSDLQR